jgi:hypothetical protein
MVAERTELEWTYRPTDFFEVPYTEPNLDYSWSIDKGKAVATLQFVQEPVDPVVEDHVEGYLRSVFLVRKMQTRREFYLDERATIYQYNAAGNKVIVLRASAPAHLTIKGGQPDILITAADGTMVVDTKAERISMLSTVASKAAQSPSLRRMLQSYSQSVSDPENELVHLYEIRDALHEHYGNNTKAKTALGIAHQDWQRLGNLASNEPLLQGRHRGKHLAGLRSATASELEEARTLASNWIMAFVRTL